MTAADSAAALPTRAELGARTVSVLNRGGRRNPDVLLVSLGPARAVVKDFAPRGAFVRRTIGRWITAREVRAWTRLDGHPAVPRFLGRIDPLAFAVEHRPGRPMRRKLRGDVPDDFLPRLEAAVAEMHARGVVHLDLRHRSNVMVDEHGAPVLIDFGSALVFDPKGWMARLLLPLLARIDYGALEKWRVRIQPEVGA